MTLRGTEIKSKRLSDQVRVTVMRQFSNPLSNVSVAAPCPADWNAMIGGDRVRFCGQCQLNVYNLSAMSKDEAESLIARTEGRLCVRFYRRKDGSILTDNCPVGLRALKRRALRIKKAVASSVLGFLAGIASNSAANRIGSYLLDRFGQSPSFGHTMGTLAKRDDPHEAVAGQLVMGLLPEGIRLPPSRRPARINLRLVLVEQFLFLSSLF